MTSVKAGTWVYDRDLGCLVPKYGRNYHDIDDKHSDLPFPMVIGGSMPAVKSMADGRIYDTKRNYEKSVHRHGCEIVGFDKRWTEHISDPGPRGRQGPYRSDKEHEADLVADVKKAIEIETSKLPPTGGLADRRLARKQKREARASK